MWKCKMKWQVSSITTHLCEFCLLWSRKVEKILNIGSICRDGMRARVVQLWSLSPRLLLPFSCVPVVIVGENETNWRDAGLEFQSNCSSASTLKEIYSQVWISLFVPLVRFYYLKSSLCSPLEFSVFPLSLEYSTRLKTCDIAFDLVFAGERPIIFGILGDSMLLRRLLTLLNILPPNTYSSFGYSWSCQSTDRDDYQLT